MARPIKGKAKLYDLGDAPAKAKAGVGGFLVLVFCLFGMSHLRSAIFKGKTSLLAFVSCSDTTLEGVYYSKVPVFNLSEGSA